MIRQNYMGFVSHEGMSLLILIMIGVPGDPRGQGGPEDPDGLGGPGGPVGLEAIIGQNHMCFVGHSYKGSMILL